MAVIRAMMPADAAALIAARLAMAQESDFLAWEPDELRTNIEDQATLLQRKLDSPVDLYILAEVEREVVGLAMLDGSTLGRFKHGVTLGLGVRRAFWRGGLGAALVRTLLDWADSREIVRVALEVVETNAAAIRLYESLGFEHEGRLRSRRKHGAAFLDAHMMARVRRPTDAP